jgi:hypothetical protein
MFHTMISKVVATFGQNHRRRFVFAAPVATDKTMPHVPVRHIFTVCHGDDIADGVCLEYIV